MRTLVRVETVNAGRRRFFGRVLMSAGAIAAVTALDGCSAVTANGVTTVTIDVAKITAYTKTAISVVNTAIAFTGLPAPVETVVTMVISGLGTGLDAWTKYSGGSATVTFDKTSVPAALSSLITDLQNAGTAIAAVASSEAATMGATLTSKVSAVATDVSSVASVISSLLSVAVSGPFDGTTWQDQRIQAIAARHGVKVGA